MPALKRGGVFQIRDEKLTLPPESQRGEAHKSARPFLVVSRDDKNADTNWPTIVGCPISSSTGYKTQYCVKLSAGTANLTKKSWVRVPAIQPISKEDITQFMGELSADLMLDVDASIAEYLDLGDDDLD